MELLRSRGTIALDNPLLEIAGQIERLVVGIDECIRSAVGVTRGTVTPHPKIPLCLEVPNYTVLNGLYGPQNRGRRRDVLGFQILSDDPSTILYLKLVEGILFHLQCLLLRLPPLPALNTGSVLLRPTGTVVTAGKRQIT